MSNSEMRELYNIYREDLLQKRIDTGWKIVNMISFAGGLYLAFMQRDGLYLACILGSNIFRSKL